MKLRKLFALLMAAIMLLGMAPAGHAEGGNLIVGGEFTVGCNHNWAWRWPNGQPAHCQDWKLSEEYCTLCGAVSSSFEQCGECQPGAWHWDGIPPANCNEWGIQNQSCSVCGEAFNEREVRGDHKWSGYTTIDPAGCETPGEEAIYCAVCGEEGDSREIPAKGHDWGDWRWEFEATCIQEGLRVRYCQRCNMREENEVRSGDHKYGDWIIDENPTCTMQGIEYKQCSVCGDTQWLYINATGHNMGEWYILEAPQAGKPGIERSDCLNACGHFITREIPALEEDSDSASLPQCFIVLANAPANGTHFVVGEEVVFMETWINNTGKTLYPFYVSIFTCDTPVYGSAIDQICSWDAQDYGPVVPGAFGTHTLTVTVTEADVARGCIYAMAELLSAVHNGSDLENVITPFVTAPCGEGKPMNSAGVRLEKFIRNAPANGEYYVPGEFLNYALTLLLDDGLLLDDAAIYDPIIDKDELVISYGEGLYGGMGMDVFYTVTAEDAQRGYVENTAYATWIYSSSGEAGYCESETVIAPCGSDNSGDFGLSAALSVTKQVTSTPANGRYYEPGEIIFFEISVTNTSAETLTNLTFRDPLISDAPGATVQTFAPGETASFQAFYPVTNADAFAGGVSNIAYVTAADADGHQIAEYSNTVTVPCRHTYLNVTLTPDNPFGIFHSLSVVKKEESLPLNGEFYTEGEVIHYAITYTNDGELPLNDVQIWDTMNISAAIGHAETLQPGESRTCYYQHTVTAKDAAVGSVVNTAQANYPIPGGQGYISVNSNPVFSKTSADGNLWIELPIFPAPDVPFIPEGETPPVAIIDTDTLHNGESYCIRAVAGRDNASVSYETLFCPNHANTHSFMLTMMQAASTPELKMQAAAYASALWRSKAEEVYQEIFDASAAKNIVMEEYRSFLTAIANYEAMLKLLYPDQPELAAMEIAALWENKCIELCYDAHADAAERKDSLLSVTAAAGAFFANCSCEHTAQEEGRKIDTLSFCPLHSFPFSMMDALLQSKDTAEGWRMVRQVWSVEMANAYNKIYAKLGENKILAAAEHHSLLQWLDAREAFLTALYPNHPEVVAQIMAKTVMERVNALCPIIGD